ncbi:MAG: hypothetical protein LUG18_08325 [Candidatus Azobacteroides sp.]|nr:hypothetical protein [Candidatus Azobacteroides sp.]
MRNVFALAIILILVTLPLLSPPPLSPGWNEKDILSNRKFLEKLIRMQIEEEKSQPFNPVQKEDENISLLTPTEERYMKEDILFMEKLKTSNWFVPVSKNNPTFSFGSYKVPVAIISASLSILYFVHRKKIKQKETK